jgi:hypothetical protein
MSKLLLCRATLNNLVVLGYHYRAIQARASTLPVSHRQPMHPSYEHGASLQVFEHSKRVFDADTSCLMPDLTACCCSHSLTVRQQQPAVRCPPAAVQGVVHQHYRAPCTGGRLPQASQVILTLVGHTSAALLWNTAHAL